jgi:DHA1 family bicyclomycin/chloramphenicol resistance-like MFS transporter
VAAIAGRNRLSNLYTGWRVKPCSAHRRGRGSASVDLRAGFTRQGRATRDGIESDSCPTSYARAAWVNDGGPDSNEAPTTPVSAARDTKRAESAAAVAIIVALSAIAPLSTDMFLPSLPTLAERFRASDATVQLAITFFLVSFAASQLVYGPASDRYGRRPLLTAGLCLFVAGSILAVNATSIEMLLAGRVLQGLGGGAGPALSQAIVLDVYGRERAGRMLAYISIVLPLAPTLAPIVGGGLQEAFGWQSVFVLLAIIGVVLLTGYRAILPETNSRIGRSGRGFGGLAADYRHLLASPTYVAYVLAIGLMFSGYLAFISSSSFVLQDELGLGAATYGLSFGFVALGLMTGATISSRLAGRLRPEQVVLLGTATATAAAAIMAALAWSGVGEVAAVLVPMFGVAVGVGTTRPAALAGALVPFPQIAGLASALLGFTQILMASSFNIVFAAAAGVSQRALATAVLLAVTTALVSVLILRPGREPERARPVTE